MADTDSLNHNIALTYQPRRPVIAVYPDGVVETSPGEALPPLTDCAFERLVDAMTKLLASYVRGGRMVT